MDEVERKELAKAEHAAFPGQDAADRFNLEHPGLGSEAATENRVAAYDVPEIPSPHAPNQPISLCHDCWVQAGRPEAAEQTDDATFDWVKQYDRARYEVLTHCERCGVKFAFVKG